MSRTERERLLHHGSEPADAVRLPCRVLVVEDNRDTAETLRDLLELCGHEVVVAHTGPDGLSFAREFRPDVVLCDIGLPGMDGYDLAAALRRDPATASARLIAVSGYGRDEDRTRALEVGFDRHMLKPVDPCVLLKELSGSNGPEADGGAGLDGVPAATDLVEPTPAPPAPVGSHRSD